MKTYLTRSNHYYTFHNGRVTCIDHGVYDAPVFVLNIKHGCLNFRTHKGWYLTTPIQATF